jgi:hypothetical protein
VTPRPTPTPAVGQFWSVMGRKVYLRRWNKERREFICLVRNSRGRMTVTPEFLTDAMHVEFLKWAELTWDAVDAPDTPTPRQLRDAANRPWREE